MAIVGNIPYFQTNPYSLGYLGFMLHLRSRYLSSLRHQAIQVVDIQNQCVQVPGVTVSNVDNLYALVVEPHWYRKLFMTHGDGPSKTRCDCKSLKHEKHAAHQAYPQMGWVFNWGIPSRHHGCFTTKMVWGVPP